MKWVGLILLAGLIPLYLLGAAFKLDLMTTEMSVHIGLRFVAGFIILGILVFYKHRIRFVNSAYIILALILADDVADYFRNVDSFKFEIVILGAYMLLWGALAGFVFMKQIKKGN